MTFTGSLLEAKPFQCLIFGCLPPPQKKAGGKCVSMNKKNHEQKCIMEKRGVDNTQFSLDPSEGGGALTACSLELHT